MKNYLYVYHSTNTEPPSPESMQAWMAWFDTLHDSLVDGGNPIMGVKAVLRDGGVGSDEEAHDSVVGYSVVKAGSLDEALALAKGNPLVGAPGCAVRVYETVEM